MGAQLAFEGQGLSLVVVGPQQGYCGQAPELEGVVKERMMTFLSLGKGEKVGDGVGWRKDLSGFSKSSLISSAG